MSPTNTSVTPNSRASFAFDMPPASNRSLISSTCSSVSFELELSSPRCEGKRPAFISSCLLSKSVPVKRCAGLTHAGLWQICRIKCPSGIALPEITNATRCARRILPNAQNSPYPSCIIPAFQMWHAPGLKPVTSTFLSKFLWFLWVKSARFKTAFFISTVFRMLARPPLRRAVFVRNYDNFSSVVNP